MAPGAGAGTASSAQNWFFATSPHHDNHLSRRHPDRPARCRSFECVWLMDPDMPHRFRPDQTQVVLDQDADGQRLIARCDVDNPRAWCREPMYGALKGYAAKTWGTGKLVMAVAGRQTWVISPRGDIALGEVDPAATLKVVEGPDGVVSVSVG